MGIHTAGLDRVYTNNPVSKRPGYREVVGAKGRRIKEGWARKGKDRPFDGALVRGSLGITVQGYGPHKLMPFMDMEVNDKGVMGIGTVIAADKEKLGTEKIYFPLSRLAPQLFYSHKREYTPLL